MPTRQRTIIALARDRAIAKDAAEAPSESAVEADLAQAAAYRAAHGATKLQPGLGPTEKFNGGNPTKRRAPRRM